MAFPYQYLSITVEQVANADTEQLKAWMSDARRAYSQHGITGSDVVYMRASEMRAYLTEADLSFVARVREKQSGTSQETARVTDTDTETKDTATETDDDDEAAIAAAIKTAIEQASGSRLEKKLRGYIDERMHEVARIKAREIVVRDSKDNLRKVDGDTHERFELVLKTVAANCPAALVGPAAGGKTTIAKQIGQALGLESVPFSFNPLTSKADLIGYRDAHGTFHSVPFLDCFENGKLFLGDEADACNAGVMTLLNGAIGNREATFGDGVTRTAHENFRIMLGCNTFNGPNADYCGRSKPDAAVQSRYVYIGFDYDWRMVRNVAGATAKSRRAVNYGLNPITSPDQWCDIVTAYHDATIKLGLRHLITPRAVFMGVRLAEQGIGIDWLVKTLLTRDLSGPDLDNLTKEASSRM